MNKRFFVCVVLLVALLGVGCKGITHTAVASSNVDFGIAGENGYSPRNENNLKFYIETNGEIAYYYYYCSYRENYLRISVDVVDSNLTSQNENVEYNDSVEFNIQPACNDIRYSPNKTYNILFNLAQQKGHLKKAVDALTLSENQLTYYLQKKLICYETTYRNDIDDGYNGVSVEIDLSYDLWPDSKDSLLGRLTIEPAARNSSMYSTVFRSCVKKGCRFSYAYHAILINADGSFSDNCGDVLELTPLMREKNLLHKNLDLSSNFASLKDNSKARLFTSGSQMFSNKGFYSTNEFIPKEIYEKTYLYDTFEGGNSFAVDEPGYIVVLAPYEEHAILHSLIDNSGFQLINSIPGKQIASSSNSVIGIQEQSSYYVKWCEKGESFSFNDEWCVVFSKKLSDYTFANKWEKELAHVYKVSSEQVLNKFAPSERLWQGIPSIEWSERDDGGSRLWASLYSGGPNEPSPYNHTLYYFSDDDGDTWDLAFAIDFAGVEDGNRCFDPSIKWDNKKLYLYWNQTGSFFYSSMVCCAIVENPGILIDGMDSIDNFIIGDPFFCSQGIKLNKPVVLTTGEWLYSAHNTGNASIVNIYSSLDNGFTWLLKGQAHLENAFFVSESSLVQIDNEGKELVLFSRTDISYYQAVNYSHDGGNTWTNADDSGRVCPPSRQCFYRLNSGNIVTAHHFDTYLRQNLFIGLSSDGCRTFAHNLVLDLRLGTSYPDIVQSKDGSIYIIWDYDRYGAKQILFVKIYEDNLLRIDGVKDMNPSLIKEMCSVIVENHTYSICGIVQDENGNPLANVDIICGDISGTTSTCGTYELKGVGFSNDSDSNTLFVKKDGFESYDMIIYNKDAINHNYHLTKNIVLINNN